MRKLKPSFAYSLSTQGERGIHPTEMSLVNDLRQEANLDVYSIGDLVNTSDSYPEAIPVLLKHLHQMKDRHFLDGVIRALTVKEARGVAFEPIYQMYIEDTDPTEHGAKFAMANALQFLAEKKEMPRIIELALDTKHGPTRVALVDRIASSAGKENTSHIKEVLQKLANDPEKGIASRAKKALQRKKFQ